MKKTILITALSSLVLAMAPAQAQQPAPAAKGAQAKQAAPGMWPSTTSRWRRRRRT
jgi:hypothetical protein